MPNQRHIRDRYRRVRRLAAGGTSEVWLARDERLDRAVAVKVLHAHLLQDGISRERLRIEARAAASLSHPGIVKVHEFVARDGHAALVMELIDGESLAARLHRDGRLGPRDAARITAQVAEALFHAHRRGVIHRDIKPGNILLDGDGRAKLVDFGIARVLSAASVGLTDPGSVMGTLRYMSPEQLAGEDVGPRTDLYSLGLVLHEMLTGAPAFAADTPVALAEAQAAGPPSLPSVDPALAAAVRACLQPAVADRPVHVGALAHALRAWLEGDPEPVRALPPAGSDDTTAVSPVVARRRSRRLLLPGASRRRFLVPLAAAVALVAAGMVAAALLMPGTPQPATVTGPTPSATSPAATPLPPWLAGLLADYEEACGDGNLAEVTAAVAGLGEEDAKAYVEEASEACREEEDDGGGDGDDRDNGGGNGRGRGNGNGNGRGDD